jgi:tetratricopeptide (TPR) repeat protein
MKVFVHWLFFCFLTLRVFAIDEALRGQIRDLYWKAERFESKHQYDQALETYDKVITLNPTNATDFTYNALCGKGYIYRQTKRFQEAIDSYKKAVEINPKNDLAFVSLAYAHEEMGDFSGAIEAMKVRIEKFGYSTRLGTFLMIYYGKAGNFEEVEKIAERIVKEDPDSVDAHAHFALVNISKGQDAAALENLRKVADLNVNKTEDRETFAKNLLEGGKKLIANLQANQTPTPQPAPASTPTK